MRKGWVRTNLGEMSKLLKERNKSKKLARVMTVSAADGLVDQEKYFKKSVASSNLTNYRVVHPGDFVYNKSTSKDAPMGVITQWDGDGPVLVSPIYLVFRTESDSSIDSYLKHYFKSEKFFASLQGLLREGARAHGALNVRQDEFLSAELVLPPLPEQQRIVDLMDSVDAAISAAQAEVDAAVALRGRVLEHELSNPGEDWVRQALGSITTNLDAKRVPIKSSERAPGPFPYYGASGVVDYVDDYIFDGLNLLISEDGENLRRRTTPIAFLADGQYWVNNHAHVISATSETTTRFLALSIEAMDISGFLSGTSRPKLTKGSLNSLPIDLPPLEAQERIVDTIEAFDAAVSTAQSALDRLRELRSSLLTVLLSGEHEIPETYDQFLTEAGEA